MTASGSRDSERPRDLMADLRVSIDAHRAKYARQSPEDDPRSRGGQIEPFTPPAPSPVEGETEPIANCVACDRDVTDHQPGLGLCRFVAAAETPRERVRQAAAFFADPLASDDDRQRFKARLLHAVDELAPASSAVGETRVDVDVLRQVLDELDDGEFATAGRDYGRGVAFTVALIRQRIDLPR